MIQQIITYFVLVGLGYGIDIMISISQFSHPSVMQIIAVMMPILYIVDYAIKETKPENAKKKVK
jgi:hypothetical protein